MATKRKKSKAAAAVPKNDQRARWVSGAVMGLVFVVFLLLPRWWQLVALLAVVFIAHHEWQKLARRTANPLLWFVVGFFYILASAVAAMYLLNLHPLWFLQTLLIVISADTGAYLVGKKWGRRKLAPSISPGKTWEGVLGGLALVNVVVFASALTFHGALRDHLAWAMLASWAIAVAAVAGDLFESYLKRRAGVKDSGNIIPGHGGVLDRIDGHLLALAVAAILVASGRLG